MDKAEKSNKHALGDADTMKRVVIEAYRILCKFRRVDTIHGCADRYSQWRFWEGWNNDFDFISVRISHESPNRISLRLIFLGCGIRFNFHR